MRNCPVWTGILLVLLVLAGNGRAQSSLSFPTYGAPDVVGEAREPCVTDSAAVVLDTAVNWENALETAQPGDRFLLRAGTYATADQLRLPAGSADQPIIIQPYNCEAVTLQGTIRPQSHNVLAGLRLELPKTSSENWVIRLDGKNLGHIEDVVIRNNTILGGKIDALRISDDVADVDITGNRIDGGSNGHVIFVTSENGLFLPDDIYIANNKLTKSYFMTTSEDMLQVRDARRVYFVRNTCTDGWLMEQCVDVKSTAVPLIITGNLFDGDNLHQGGPGEDGAAGCMVIHETDGHLENHRITDNYFANCTGTTIRFASGDLDEISRATVQRNVMVHPSSEMDAYVIPIWQAQDVVFSSNTIIRGHLKLGDSAQIKLPQGTVLQNNIFYQTRIDDRTLPPDSVYTCSHNLLYQTAGAGFVNSPCANTLFAAPMFVDLAGGDFHLQAGSPAQAAGINGVDLGAYPYASIVFTSHLYLPAVQR